MTITPITKALAKLVVAVFIFLMFVLWCFNQGDLDIRMMVSIIICVVIPILVLLGLDVIKLIIRDEPSTDSPSRVRKLFEISKIVLGVILVGATLIASIEVIQNVLNKTTKGIDIPISLASLVPVALAFRYGLSLVFPKKKNKSGLE